MCADHEKLYFSPSKNQIFKSKFFRQETGEKISLQNSKIDYLKMLCMTQGDVLVKKNYILAHQNINFSDRNFFVRKCEKNFFKIGKWN